MKKVLIVLALLYSGTAFSKVDCSRHKIYCKIVSLNPSIDTDFAFKLSNILYKKAKKYGTNPLTSVAISMQESSIRNINRESLGIDSVCLGVIRKEDRLHCRMHSTTKIISDVGIFQIHVATAKNFGFDITRLMFDIDYQVECHLKILKQKLKICKHLGSEAWSCYHSTTPKYRSRYVKAVSRYLN